MAADVMQYVDGAGPTRNNRITVKTQGGDQHKDSGDDKASSDTHNFNIAGDKFDDPTYYG
jgi:hypothetical protein